MAGLNVVHHSHTAAAFVCFLARRCFERAGLTRSASRPSGCEPPGPGLEDFRPLVGGLDRVDELEAKEYELAHEHVRVEIT